MPVNRRVLEAGQRYMAMQAARHQMAQRSYGGQVGGRGVMVGPVGVQRAGQQQQQLSQQANNNRWAQAQAEYKAQVHPQHGGGGPGGFLGAVMDNPIVSTLVKPLQAISYPLKAIDVGLQEARAHLPEWAPLLSGIGAPLMLIDKQKAEHEKRGVLERIADPSYGFGQIATQINTGNDFIDTWANRGVGLGGDIALDPLTYLTAGVNKIPGATGRLALAAEAAEKGLSEEAIRAAGQGGARAVRKLGEEGAVEALKLPEPGIRFGGQMGVRIPGTGGLSEQLNALTHGVSGLAADTKFGRAVRMAGAARNPELRGAVESLVGRGAEKYTPSVAAEMVRSGWLAKAEQSLTTSIGENAARDIARKAKDDPALTHALETGDLSNPLVAKWHKLNQDMRAYAISKGGSVGQLADEELTYAPRVLTKQGKADFAHATSNLRGAAEQFGAEGQQFSRVLKKGETYIIKGKEFKPLEGTIKEANDWGVRELGHKLFEDSPAKLSAYTVEQSAGTVGKAQRLQALAKGVHQKVFSTIDPRVTSIDEAATRAASKETGGALADQLAPILGNVSAADEAVARTGQAADEAAQMLQSFDRGAMRGQRSIYGDAYGAANAAQAAHGEALAAAPDVSGQIAPLQARLAEAQTAEQAARGPVEQLQQLAAQGVQGPRAMPDFAQAQFGKLQAQYDLLDKARLAAPAGSKAEDQAIRQLMATKMSMDDITRKFSTAVEAAPLPEAAPFQEALQGATGARQGLEEQLAPLTQAQAAHEAVGPPPNVDEMVAAHAQPRLDALAQAREPFVHYRNATDMSNLMAEASQGLSERELQAATAHLPESAQAMMHATVRADSSPPAMGKWLDDIRQGKLDDQIVRQANDGFERVATDQLIGRDIVMNSESRQAMADAKQAMDRFNAAFSKEPGLFGKVVDEYTKFFKAWATATPGFHIRNALSATFMNMSEGVSFREMLDGNLIWSTFRKEYKHTTGSDAAAWVSKLPEHLRPIAEDVVKAVYASGAGGRYTAAELGERAFGETATEGGKIGSLLRKTYENKPLEFSHTVGEHIEGRVRAGLAVHALGPDGSGSWSEAVARIKRVHFDYSDVNALDRSVRRIVPFWTFMSRNLPLQVQQMWVAPRVYSQYESVMRNLNADPTGTQAMPDWLSRTGAIFLNKQGLALAPDVGASQVENYLGQIADPKTLASNFTPPLKSAIELGTNTDLFYGNKYKANDYQKPGIESMALLPFLSALGMTKNTAQGPVVENKVLQAIRDNIPLLATANRLGSTTADREGKGWQSVANFLGVPLRQVDPKAQARRAGYDTQHQRYAATALRDALARFGGAA